MVRSGGIPGIAEPFLFRHDLDRIGAVEVAGNDGVRAGGVGPDLARGVDGDGVAGFLHVRLRAHLLDHAAAGGAHQLVGLGVDTMLGGLRAAGYRPRTPS